MRILLISPKNNDGYQHSAAASLPFLARSGFGAQMAPPGIAVIAALTPREHAIMIHDEALHGAVEQRLARERFDIIGVSAIINQMRRTYEIFHYCRENKIPGVTVLGGPGPTGMPESGHALLELVDVMFFGEAEETWPQFLQELSTGTHARLYRQVLKPDMSKSPPPRWDAFAPEDLRRYPSAPVQTTRGCPFDCQYCDVIYLFGRRPRHKAIPQVLEEVRTLYRLGISSIFVADDDFVGDKHYAKALLRALLPLNQRLPAKMKFITQADITVAEDPELLELLADCNFTMLLIGIESPNEATLKDYHKLQNLKRNIKDSVLTVQSYGIAVGGAVYGGCGFRWSRVLSDDLRVRQRGELGLGICLGLDGPRGHAALV